jgi:chemotaxis protein MotB
MRVARTKVVIPLACVVGLFLVSGCTDYKKKYDYLNVEHQNLQGRYENLEKTNQDLADRISKDQELINGLQKQIEEGKKTPSETLGLPGGVLDPVAGTITVTLMNEILFDSGKATLKSSTNKELDQIITALNDKYKGKRIDVVGHTDTDPINKTKDKWDDNWDLSTARALAVAHYLMNHGIPDELVMAGGCGPARPVAPNNSTVNKGKNRRVEVVVHLRQQAPKAAQPKSES